MKITLTPTPPHTLTNLSGPYRWDQLDASNEVESFEMWDAIAVVGSKKTVVESFKETPSQNIEVLDLH